MSYEILISLHSANDDLINLYRQLLDRNQLTDVVIVTEGRHFHAHRILLALYSKYFRELFLNVAVNANKSDLLVCLKDVSFTTLQYIIDLIYGGSANLCVEDLDDFLAAAKYLQIKGFYDNDRSISSDVSIDSNTTVSSDETTDSSIISDCNCSKHYCHEINLSSPNCGNYMKFFNEKTKSDVRDFASTPLQNNDVSNDEASTSSENKAQSEVNLLSGTVSSTQSSSDEILIQPTTTPSKHSNTSGDEVLVQVETASIQCNFCAQTLTRKEYLRQHQRSQHLFLLLQQNKSN